MNNLLLPAVNKGDLWWRLNYSKTVFGWGSAPDPSGRAHGALSDPVVRWGGLLPPRFPPLLSQDPRAPCSPSELAPPFYRPKLCPCCHGISQSFSDQPDISIAHQFNITNPNILLGGGLNSMSVH